MYQHGQRVGRFILVWLALSTIADCTTKELGMIERILSIMKRSEATVLMRAGEQVAEPSGNQNLLRYEIEVPGIFHGSSDSWTGQYLVVEEEGIDTFQPSPGQSYLVFLVYNEDGQRCLAPLAPIVPVPDSMRVKYSEWMRDYAALAVSDPAAPPIKDHIFNMLTTGVEFFQLDGALEAQFVENWRVAEIQRLIEIVRGDNTGRPLEGRTREIVTCVIVGKGEASQVKAFARQEMLAGCTDNVYWGLHVGRPTFGDSLLSDYLSDYDVEVRIQAIRLAGLLRRADALDLVENRVRLEEPDEINETRILEAIAKARDIVDRD